MVWEWKKELQPELQMAFQKESPGITNIEEANRDHGVQ